MKSFSKILSLMLAVLFLVTSFALVACDNTPADTTEKQPSDGTTTNPPVDKPVDPEIEDSLPADLRFDGETITFFTRNSTGNLAIFDYEICSDDTSDVLQKAVHDRNIDVETRLGVTIKNISQPGGWSVAKEWFEQLATAVNTQSSDYDASAIYSTYGSTYALQGLYYNLKRLTNDDEGGYLDLEKPWWNQSVIDGFTLYDSLYFLAGDLTISGIAYSHALWFNKDIFNQEFPEENVNVLYNAVENGTWTVDMMAGYVSEVWEDVNSSGAIDDGDIVGLKQWLQEDPQGMNSWLYAMDIQVLDRNVYGDYEVADFAPRLVPAWEAVRNMYTGDGAHLEKASRREYDDTTFAKGNVMFTVSGVGDGTDYREVNLNYGILPLPKYNVEQDDYANGMWNYASFIVILNHLSDERAKMASAVIELMAAESYKTVTPAYYSKVINGQYSKEENDSKMFDIVIRTCKFDFAEVWGLGMSSFFQDFEKDVQATIDANRDTTWPTKLEELLAGLEERADIDLAQ